MTVHVIATGGTISSHLGPDGWTNITGRALVDELGPLPVPVVVHDIAAGPSSHLSVADMVTIVGRIRDSLDLDATGVVVVHGTDTIELTAFVAQLLLGTSPMRAPVVFTGSMRVHSHPLPDGPRNLVDAITLAADPAAVGRDVLVCLDGHVHLADRVIKVDATSLDAFSSAPFAPVATVADGVVSFSSDERRQRVPASSMHPDVALVTCYPGIDPHTVASAIDGRAGAVVEGFGDLNVPAQLWGPIHLAARAGTLVVLGSRPFTHTATGEGLQALGAIGAGGLTAQRARLAVMAALGSCPTRDDAVAFVHSYRLEHHVHDRSSTA
jgi:L-asparaginase